MDGRTEVVLKKTSQILRSTVAGYGLKDKKHTHTPHMKYKKRVQNQNFCCTKFSLFFLTFFFLWIVVLYWKQFFFSIFLCDGLLKKCYDFPIVFKSHLPPPTLGNLKISTFATNKSKISKDLSHSTRMKSGMNGWNMFNDGNFFTVIAVVIVVVVLVCW